MDTSKYISMAEYIENVMDSMTEEEKRELRNIKHQQQQYSQEQSMRMSLINHICKNVYCYEQNGDSQFFTLMTKDVLKELFKHNLFLEHDEYQIEEMTRNEVDESGHKKSFLFNNEEY